MIKKIISILFTVAIVASVGGVFIYKNLNQKINPRSDTYGAYKFVRLPEGLIARSGTLEVKTQSVLDPAYVEMNERKQALLVMMAYEQFLTQKDFRSATFSMVKFSRPIAEYCNIYGVNCAKASQINFDAHQKEFLVVDGKPYEKEDLRVDDLRYQAVRTEILNHLLKNIRAEIRRRFYKDFSNKNKSGGLKSLELQIAALKQSTDVSNETPEEKERIHDEALDRYIEKTHLSLPIEVSVELPDFEFDMKWDWVAHINNQESSLRVIFITDYKSQSSRDLIHNIPLYAKTYPHVLFAHRPFFDRKDRYQIMLGEMAMCVWQKHSSQFWNFLSQATEINQNEFEKELNEILTALKINTAGVKKCFLTRKYKDAVEYHLKWGEQLKIPADPVAVIGREVYIGTLDSRVLKEILIRQ